MPSGAVDELPLGKLPLIDQIGIVEREKAGTEFKIKKIRPYRQALNRLGIKNLVEDLIKKVSDNEDDFPMASSAQYGEARGALVLASYWDYSSASLFDRRAGRLNILNHEHNVNETLTTIFNFLVHVFGSSSEDPAPYLPKHNDPNPLPARSWLDVFVSHFRWYVACLA